MRGWNANTWIAVILGAIVVVSGIDIGRRLTTGAGGEGPPAPDPEPQKKLSFKVGDAAPDFSLPDGSGKQVKLSSFVKRDTLLCFICGCGQCLELQTFVGKLAKKLGPKMPAMLAVSTTEKEREATWRRDTGVEQKMLFEKPDKKAMDTYQGHPCPRVFRLNPGPTVTWIGPSPADVPATQVMGMQLAKQLGYPQDQASKLYMTPQVADIAVVPVKGGANAMTTSSIPTTPRAPDLSLPPYLRKSPYEN